MLHQRLAALTCFGLFVGIGVPLRADIVLEWATNLDAASGVSNPENALEAPDDLVAGFEGEPCEATYSGFRVGNVFSIDLPSLATFLGVTEETLAEADFITFERNGTAGQPFESGMWTFDDGTTSFAVYHDYDNPGEAEDVIAFGNVTREECAGFFGFPYTPADGDFAYLVIKLNASGLDLFSPNLSVTLTAGGGTGGESPEPDCMAFLRWTPIPTVSEWGIAVMALLVLTAGTVVFVRRRAEVA